MEFCLATVGALSARRDNILVGRAGYALGVQISDLSFSRVSHPLSELDASLSQSVSLSES